MERRDNINRIKDIVSKIVVKSIPVLIEVAAETVLAENKKRKKENKKEE